MDMRNSWRASSRNGWQRSGSYGMLSRQSQTCNVRGRCFSSAQGHDANTCCALSHHDSAQDDARGHDLGMQRTMEALLGRIPGSPAQVEMAQHITILPMRMGGLGLRSAMRTAPGAYWASWADALHMLQQRLPQLTGLVVHHLSHPNASGCLGELQHLASRLDRDGFVSRPNWDMLRRGVRPRPPQIVEPGEWHHGWQYYSSSNSEHQFRETVGFAQSCAADQAHLR